MLRIAICDDERNIREQLRKLTETSIQAEVLLFETGEELLAADMEYDILLLDICLGEGDGEKKSGIELAKKIRKNSNVIIIFITALKEYVFEAYDVEAFHYLLKPVNEEKLREVLKKAEAKIEERKEEKPLTIKINGVCKQIPVNEICYAENDKRKIILHTKNEVYTFYEKMEDLHGKLGENFFRSHRGYLVHLQEISGYDHNSIFLKNGETIFLARQKYNDFVTAYMHYLAK